MAKHGPIKASAARGNGARDGSRREAGPAARPVAPVPDAEPTEPEATPAAAAAAQPVSVVLKEGPEVEQHGRFKVCAETHGVRLHRIHVLSATKLGSFQSTLVFDCICGQRWLLRVMQGDVVSVDTGILEELRRGREGQATAPPGYPGAPASAPVSSGRKRG